MGPTLAGDGVKLSDGKSRGCLINTFRRTGGSRLIIISMSLIYIYNIYNVCIALEKTNMYICVVYICIEFLTPSLNLDNKNGVS